jgi:protein gp37
VELMTKIEWTDATWNPMTGCSKVSPGCANCYAERMARRLCAMGQRNYAMGFRPQFHPHMLDKPLRWRKPRHVFVCSMSDLFHEAHSDEQIAAVFGVMAACPQHTFQVLTKRPERMVEWFRWYEGSSGAGASELGAVYAAADYVGSDIVEQAVAAWPIPNVWLGVTAEDQQRADERIPLLLQVPAAVRFVSCEPLLEQVVLRPGEWIPPLGGGPKCNIFRPWEEPLPSLDWVIAGCESGPGARGADANWFRVLREQCQAAGVSYFLKQMMVPQAGAKPKLAKIPALDGRVWDQRPTEDPAGAGGGEG